jgi:hypothetical protein
MLHHHECGLIAQLDCWVKAQRSNLVACGQLQDGRPKGDVSTEIAIGAIRMRHQKPRSTAEFGKDDPPEAKIKTCLPRR